ncbi:hypothetical protein GCM10007919_51540 [Rhizobium indigoferae]|nr:hypothetical protein GCM10007919_51540 [Rhizobium indigoferae]
MIDEQQAERSEHRKADADTPERQDHEDRDADRHGDSQQGILDAIRDEADGRGDGVQQR